MWRQDFYSNKFAKIRTFTNPKIGLFTITTFFDLLKEITKVYENANTKMQIYTFSCCREYDIPTTKLLLKFIYFILTFGLYVKYARNYYNMELYCGIINNWRICAIFNSNIQKFWFMIFRNWVKSPSSSFHVALQPHFQQGNNNTNTYCTNERWGGRC